MSPGLGAGCQAGAFDRARRETLRYHEDLYATAARGVAGTWLARPHRLLHDALALVPSRQPVIAYDLGAGLGRHTIPMMRSLPAGSVVYAVDLLSSALQSLPGAVPPGVGTVLRTRQGDLDDFVFETPADLVLAFSAIEHLPDLGAIGRLLRRAGAAATPGGVVAVGIVADRFEIGPGGKRRPALLESAISSTEAVDVLSGAFGDFEVVYQDKRPASVREDREGEGYTLASTLVTWLGTRLSAPRPAAPGEASADSRR